MNELTTEKGQPSEYVQKLMTMWFENNKQFWKDLEVDFFSGKRANDNAKGTTADHRGKN